MVRLICRSGYATATAARTGRSGIRLVWAISGRATLIVILRIPCGTGLNAGDDESLAGLHQVLKRNAIALADSVKSVAADDLIAFLSVDGDTAEQQSCSAEH